MNDEIVKQAACFIKGGSTFTQEEREEMARAILALYPSRDIAVSIVDAVHGYTCEFSSDPAYHASQYDTAEQVIEDALGRGPVQYLIGDQTAERVFKAAGLVNMSDLQAVMDAVEKALVSEGVPVAWIEPYILETLKEGGSGMFPISNSRFREKNLSTPLYERPQIKPLEWKRGEYISTAKSIDNLAFTAQYIGDGNEGWALHTYLMNETKRTHHPTREAAEQAAQALHNAELVKYLSG